MTAVTDVKGVGEALGQALIHQWFQNRGSHRQGNPADLVKVPRIGTARAQAHTDCRR